MIAEDVQLTQGVLQMKFDVDAAGGLFTVANFSITDVALGDSNFVGAVDVLNDAFVLIANLGKSNDN